MVCCNEQEGTLTTSRAAVIRTLSATLVLQTAKHLILEIRGRKRILITEVAVPRGGGAGRPTGQEAWLATGRPSQIVRACRTPQESVNACAGATAAREEVRCAIQP